MKNFLVRDSGESYKLQAENLLEAKLAVLRYILENNPEVWNDTISYYLDLDVEELDELPNYFSKE